MVQKYRNRNTLKNLPFYSEEIKSVIKENKKTSNISLLSELPLFYKEPKKLTNIELSKELVFHTPEKKKDLKD